MTYESRPSPLTVTALQVGAVRLSATLQPEEVQYGAFVRDVHPDTIRALAAELTRAVDEAEEMWGQLNAAARSDPGGSSSA